MSFREQSIAFLDELSSIAEESQKNRDEYMKNRHTSPFSSLLTQDEEPSGEYNYSLVDEPEPQVIVRG